MMLPRMPEVLGLGYPQRAPAFVVGRSSALNLELII